MLTDEPGKVFVLDQDEMVIGKRADCDILLPDRHVSRSHARILRRSDGLYIENLENLNKTKVNGVLLTEPRRLTNGDLITICKYTLMYDASDAFSKGMTKILETIDLTKTTSGSLSQVRSEAKLQVIMDLTAELVGILDLTAVLEKVLDALFRIFPYAERGFVLFPSSVNDCLITRARKFRHDEEHLMPSRTIYNLVTGEGHAILFDDVLHDSRFLATGSVKASQVHSIMCAPLFDKQRRPVGILHVDTRDHRNRFKQQDLDFLVAVAGTISLAVESARLHEIEIRHRKLEQEARDAWIVQRSFIPELYPCLPRYEFWHLYEPARFVAGDYFDYRQLTGTGSSLSESQGKRWAIAMGDVSGKGMPAALLMARISAEVRLLLQVEPDPARIVGLINRNLCQHEAAGRFVTFLLIILDARQHRLTIVNAGHMGPLVRRFRGDVEVVGQDRSGLPLGIEDDREYEAMSIRLGSGDVVVLYTDGVTEALSPEGEQFGATHLHKHIALASPSAGSVGTAIKDGLCSHVADRDQFDDITLICFGRS
jgi:serine phosphatase RsbU (regulator of sigma subunit)